MSTKNIDASNNDLDEINLLNSLRIKEKELELELQKNNNRVENTTISRSFSNSEVESYSATWENTHWSENSNTSKYAWFGILSQNFGGGLLRFKNNVSGYYEDSGYIKGGWRYEDTLASKAFLALHTASNDNPLTIRNGKVGINLNNDYDEPSHELEVKGIADGDVAKGIKAYNPILAGQLSREEIEQCSKDPNKQLSILKKIDQVEVKERKKPKYTPLSKRQDRPDAILWLCKNASELTDGQISKLVGSTKGTVSLIRKRSYWNFSNLKPRDPVILALCTQEAFKKSIEKAKRRVERERKAKIREEKKAQAASL